MTYVQSAAVFQGLGSSPYRLEMEPGAGSQRVHWAAKEADGGVTELLDRGPTGSQICPRCQRDVPAGAWVCPHCKKRMRSTSWPPADMAIAMGYHPLRNPIVLGIFTRYVHAILGQRRRVTLAEEGHTASTDLQGTIQINPMVLGDRATIGDNLAVSWGMLEHEMGHERYTPLQVFQTMLQHAGMCPTCAVPVEPGQECPKCGKYHRPAQGPLGEAAMAVLPQIYNILEDGRMERVLAGNDPYAARLVAVSRYLTAGGQFGEDPPWSEQKRVTRLERLGYLMLFEAIPSMAVPQDLLSGLSDKDRNLWDNELLPLVQEAVRSDAARSEQIAEQISAILEREGIATPRSRLPSRLAQGVTEGKLQGSPGADGSAPKPAKPLVIQDPDGSLARSLREMRKGRQDGDAPQGGQQGRQGGGGDGQQKCPECGGFLDQQGNCPRCGGAGLGEEEEGEEGQAGPRDNLRDWQDSAGQEEEAEEWPDDGGKWDTLDLAEWDDVLGEEKRREGEGSDQEGQGGLHGTGKGHAPPAWAASAFDPAVARSVDVVQADMYRRYSAGVVKHFRGMRRDLARRVAEMRTGELAVPTPSGDDVVQLCTVWREHGSQKEWRAPYAAMKDVARKLALRIRRAQQEVERDKFLEPRGLLDRTRIVSAAKGEKNVFMRNGPGRGQSMAFSISADVSGSMCGQITRLQVSLAMMGAALEELRIPHEVVSFDSGPVQVLKTWDDPRLEEDQIDTLDSRGGTSYREPLARAMLSISSRNEKKKVVLFLSDGAPNESFDMLRRQYVQPMRDQGIILVPMLYHDSPPLDRSAPRQPTGALEDGPSYAMDQIWGEGQWIRISDLRQLPDVLMGFIQRTLVDRR